MYIAKICPTCNNTIPAEKKSNKFCSQSCAATYNNKGIRRHGNDPGKCKLCGADKSSVSRKYCSIKCSAVDRKFRTKDEIRTRRNEISAAYRAKLKNQTPNNIDRKAIQSFYENCPQGYEVDHVIPISKGGLHVLENLQYLTISDNRRKSNKLVDPLGLEPR